MFSQCVRSLLHRFCFLSLTNTDRWSHVFIHFCKAMEEQGFPLYTLYTTFPNGQTLASNHQERGVHFDHTLGRNLPLVQNFSYYNNDPFDIFPPDPTKFDWALNSNASTRADDLISTQVRLDDTILGVFQVRANDVSAMRIVEAFLWRHRTVLQAVDAAALARVVDGLLNAAIGVLVGKGISCELLATANNDGRLDCRVLPCDAWRQVLRQQQRRQRQRAD